MRDTDRTGSEPLDIGTSYWLKGRAIGAMVFAAFGAGDMLWGAKFLNDPSQVWSALIKMVALTIAIWAITQRVLLGRLPKPVTNKALARQNLRYYAVRFSAIVVIEAIAINLGGPVLAHFHRPDLFPQWLEAVVGIHFLPLARLFAVRLFYVTGVALLLFALGSLLIPDGRLRAITAVAGSGICLWVAAIVILLADAAYVRPAKA
jgi:hypothetical protein